MTLKRLDISHLRNIHSEQFFFHPRINLISGNNGSGKTSFLEAIYLLSSGHSFRAREISALVSHQHDTLTVFAKTMNEQSISLQKSLFLPTTARLNGVPCVSSSELASFLPCQIFYQDIFQFIDAGPAMRRSLLDWGLFHFQQDYHHLWKNYRRVLKHRNSLLKQRAPLSEFFPWNSLLADLALKLDACRVSYSQQLDSLFRDIIVQLSDLPCQLHYYRGWDRRDEGKKLETILQASYETDKVRQFTQYGAHQADLSIVCDDRKLRHYLSRGQQKMVLFALKFAQAQLVSTACVFLIDDLTAELDDAHIQRLVNYMSVADGQFFITVRPNDLPLFSFNEDAYHLFQVDDGKFQPMHTIDSHGLCFT